MNELLQFHKISRGDSHGAVLEDGAPSGDLGKHAFTKMFKMTPAAELDARVRSRVPMSIDDMLAWQPSSTAMQISYLTHLKRADTINPSEHTRTVGETIDERKQIFRGLQAFLADPEIADYVSEAFHVDEAALRGRPALHIVPDELSPFVSGKDSYRYIGKVHQMPSAILYFILENGTDPLAYVGFNEFEDGVEIRYYHGVKSSKIAKGTFKDLGQLGDWQGKIVGLVEKYAQYKGLTYSMILPANESIWLNNTTFTKEKAEKIYDQRARDRGYDYNPKLRRYIKVLDEQSDPESPVLD